MPNCIFCKIIAGEIPSEIVFQDDFAVAFLDIGPANPGHTLVVPREHSDNFSVMPDGANTQKLFEAVRRVAAAACEATGAKGHNVIINTGAVAGQIVMHTHVHVIPRFPDDGHKHWGKMDIAPAAIAKTAAEMRKLL